jgi:signal transduction histidine kinase
MDVTQRVKDEQQIKAQLEKLKEIAWHQSHIIRAPLVNILGIVNLLNDTKAMEEIENRDLIDKLKISADKLDAVIKDIVKITE